MADDQALIDALAGRGLSRKTVAVYLVAIRKARAELDLETVRPSELAEWASGLPSSRSTRALFRSALKAYWSATGRLDGPSAAVPVPRRRRMRCRALEEAEASALAAVARRRALAGTRKGLAVLFGLYGGLRRTEISEVRWSSIRDGWLTVVGKGAEREIPVHPLLLEALDAVRTGGAALSPVRARPPRDQDRVFVGLRGDALNPTTVWTWVKQLAEEAGIPPVQTHVLRHTALATALDATGDLRAVQELAGHARPETTAGYTRVRAERLVGAVAAIGYDR